jgi:hypothetical protein
MHKPMDADRLTSKGFPFIHWQFQKFKKFPLFGGKCPAGKPGPDGR